MRPPCAFQTYSPWTTMWSPNATGTRGAIEMLCSTSRVRSPEESLRMNCSCVPVELVRSGSSRVTVPSAVTSTFDCRLWKSATIAASSGCADPPHAASSTARPPAKTRAIVCELTNLHVSRHRGVDRAVILDIARGVEGNEEFGARAAQAGVKGRVVVGRDAVLGVGGDPIPLDCLSLGHGQGRRLEFADRVRVGIELDDLGCRAAGRAALGRAGGGAAVAARTAACGQYQATRRCHDCHLPHGHVVLLAETVDPPTECTERLPSLAPKSPPAGENQVLTVVTRAVRRTRDAPRVSRARSRPPR